MKKIVVLFLLSLFTLHATENVFNDKTLDEKIKIKKHLSLKKVKMYFSDFIDITGESKENFNKMINEAYNKDIHFLRAIDKFSKFDKAIKFKYYDPTIGENKNVKSYIPDYEYIFNELHESVSKYHNILSAYKGSEFIGKTILMLDSTGKISSPQVHTLINKHYPIFIKTLSDRGYCYGYSMGVNFYADTSEYARDKSKFNYFLKKGYPICKTQFENKKIPKFLYISLARQFSIENAKKMRRVQIEKRIKEREKSEKEIFIENGKKMKKALKEKALNKGKK